MYVCIHAYVCMYVYMNSASRLSSDITIVILSSYHDRWIDMYTYISSYIYRQIDVYIYIYIYTCMYVFTHMYVCM